MRLPFTWTRLEQFMGQCGDLACGLALCFPFAGELARCDTVGKYDALTDF